MPCFGNMGGIVWNSICDDDPRNKAQSSQDVEKVFKGCWANLGRPMFVPVSLEVSLGLSVIIMVGFGGGVPLPDKSRADFLYWLWFIKIRF